MASNQPMTGRDVIPAGIDVRTIRKPINEAFASVPIELIGEGAATSTDGRRMSFTVAGEDIFYISLNNRTLTNGTYRYGWTAVNQDRETGNWTNCVRAGNATTDDWATELNNANVTVGDGARYMARTNPQSGRVTFFFKGSGGGGGSNHANCLFLVSTCQMHVESFVHFPLFPAETITNSTTPDRLRFYQVGGPGTCALLGSAENAEFGGALLSTITLTIDEVGTEYVYWRRNDGTLGYDAEVRLRLADWSLQGAIGYSANFEASGTQKIFAINWELPSPAATRMLANTTGTATLDRAYTNTTVGSITNITNPPPVPGFTFVSLVEYTDTTFATCKWGGTNPVIKVTW